MELWGVLIGQDLIEFGGLILSVVTAFGCAIAWFIDHASKAKTIEELIEKLDFLLKNKLATAKAEIEKFLERCKADILAIRKEIWTLEERLDFIVEKISFFLNAGSVPDKYTEELDRDRKIVLEQIQELQSKLREIEERSEMAKTVLDGLSKADLYSAKQEADVQALIGRLNEGDQSARVLGRLTNVEVSAEAQHIRELETRYEEMRFEKRARENREYFDRLEREQSRRRQSNSATTSTTVSKEHAASQRYASR